MPKPDFDAQINIGDEAVNFNSAKFYDSLIRCGGSKGIKVLTVLWSESPEAVAVGVLMELIGGNAGALRMLISNTNKAIKNHLGDGVTIEFDRGEGYRLMPK